jgi:hypothetical protein
MRIVEIYSFRDGQIAHFDVFYKDTTALIDALEAVAS